MIGNKKGINDCGFPFLKQDQYLASNVCISELSGQGEQSGRTNLDSSPKIRGQCPTNYVGAWDMMHTSLTTQPWPWLDHFWKHKLSPMGDRNEMIIIELPWSPKFWPCFNGIMRKTGKKTLARKVFWDIHKRGSTVCLTLNKKFKNGLFLPASKMYPSCRGCESSSIKLSCNFCTMKCPTTPWNPM